MMYFFSTLSYNFFIPEMFFSASLLTLLCIYLFLVLSGNINQQVSLISAIKSSVTLTIYNDITAVKTFVRLLLFILLLCLDLLFLTLQKFDYCFSSKAYIFLYFDSLCITYDALIYKIILTFLIIIYLSLCFFLVQNFSTHVEHYFLISLVFLGGLVLFSANNFLVIFLAIELVSIPMYILSGLNTKSNFSTEAGLKYLIIGAVSSAFLMLGFAYIYGSLGVSSMSDFALIGDFSTLDWRITSSNWHWFLSHLFENFLIWDFSRVIEVLTLIDIEFRVLLGILFLFIALLLKLGIAPFHFWMPDVYIGAPSNITLFFMTVQKFILWVFFFEFYVNYLPENIANTFVFFFYFIILMNILFGIFPALYQDKFKKLMIYSSIGINSYLILALLQMSNTYFLLFLITYIFNIFGLFSIFFSFQTSTGFFLNKFSLYRNLYISYPVIAFILVLFLLSVAGLPPTFGFIAKFIIYLTNFSNNFFIVICVLVASTAMAFYYFRIIRFMFVSDNKQYKWPISWVFFVINPATKLFINYFVSYASLLLIILLVYYRKILFYLDTINSSANLINGGWPSIF